MYGQRDMYDYLMATFGNNGLLLNEQNKVSECEWMVYVIVLYSCWSCFGPFAMIMAYLMKVFSGIFVYDI